MRVRWTKVLLAAAAAVGLTLGTPDVADAIVADASASQLSNALSRQISHWLPSGETGAGYRHSTVSPKVRFDTGGANPDLPGGQTTIHSRHSVPTAEAVPESAIWMIMVIALGGVGSAMRRRKLRPDSRSA
jgi:hypothetical protein